MLSIAIPTYEMLGKGVEFLEYQFNIFLQKSFKDFEVVVSDHSLNESIKALCKKYKDTLNIIYIKNELNRGNSSANINNAIKCCSGDIIKILFQDDFLYKNTSLEKIYKTFTSEVVWAVTGSKTTSGAKMVPRYGLNIHHGVNTISSPSVLAIRNYKPLLFDENLIYLMDVEYYKRLYDTFGLPQILDDCLVVNRLWSGQVQQNIATETIRQELNYVKKIHD